MTALYNRVRPTALSKIVGHKTAVAQFVKIAAEHKSGKPHQHSYILTGPSGVGKTTLARIMANEFAGGKATLANIDEVSCAFQSGKEDVERIVNRTMYRAVGQSPIKAVILDEAHRLSTAAWNALLKPIEEPPPHVYWFICTTELGKVPKTVQTRCAKVDLKPLSEKEILDVLDEALETENIKIKDDVLDVIIEASGGSARQALVYLEQCLSCATVQDARNLTRTAGQSKDLADLGRLLLSRNKASWTQAIKVIKAMDEPEAESVRIGLCNYIGAALLNTTSEKDARNMLMVLECFSTAYNQSERLAPLLLSVGLALRMNE